MFIGAGMEGRKMSGGEGVVRVVCAPGTWGQWVRVRGSFSTVRGRLGLGLG